MLIPFMFSEFVHFLSVFSRVIYSFVSSEPIALLSSLLSIWVQLPAAPPPEDNGHPAGEAAVTGSDSQCRAQRHRHQTAKVNCLVCNTAKTLTFRECSSLTPEGWNKITSHQQGLSIHSWQHASPKNSLQITCFNSTAPMNTAPGKSKVKV